MDKLLTHVMDLQKLLCKTLCISTRYKSLNVNILVGNEPYLQNSVNFENCNCFTENLPQGIYMYPQKLTYA